jgi:hypothetical protein
LGAKLAVWIRVSTNLSLSTFARPGMKNILRLLGLLGVTCWVLAVPFVHMNQVFELNLPTGYHEDTNLWWDVQHWADDSTYGWAYVANDSIYYAVHAGDAPTAWRNEALFTGYNNEQHSVDRTLLGVRLIRLSAPDSALGLIVLGDVCTYGGNEERDRDWVAGFFNLETNSMIGRWQGNALSVGSYCGSTTGIIQAMALPAPPNAAQEICVVTNRSESCSGFGSWTSANTFALLNGRLWANEVGYTYTYQVSHVEPFIDSDSCRIVYSMKSTECYGSERDGWYECDTDCRMGTANLNAQTMHQDSQFWCHRYTAQGDGSGARRIIFHGHSGFTALDAQSFDTLWHQWAIPGDSLITARLFGSPDERLMVYYPSGRFYAVYSAFDGDSLGVTSSLEGRPSYTIKSFNRSAEFVTYDRETGLVRVYRTAPGGLSGLTLYGSQDGLSVQLRWPAVVGAVAYTVYASPNEIGPFRLIGRRLHGERQFEAAVNGEDRFFYVTAEVPDE